MTIAPYTPMELSAAQEQYFEERLSALIQYLNAILMKAKPQLKYSFNLTCHKNDVYLPPHSIEKLRDRINDSYEQAGWNASLDLSLSEFDSVVVNGTISPKEKSNYPYR